MMYRTRAIFGRHEIFEILQNKAKEKSTTAKKEAEKEDNRDNGQFIKGEDMKEQDKKKKKQKSKEGASFEAEVELKEANEKSTSSKREENANICFGCRSPATSTKLSKCRGCQKVS